MSVTEWPRGDQFNQNFALLLWRAAREHANRTAIAERGVDPVTYGALAGRAGAFASVLAERGVKAGDRISVLLPRGADAAAAFYGAMATGAVVTLVNELYRPRQVEYVLGHTEARFLITTPAMLEQLGAPLGTDVPRLDPAEVPASGSFTPVAMQGNDPAQIVYTSGSTGNPKGVLTSHANLWWGGVVVTEYLGITSTDVVGSLLPFSFVYGMSQLTCTIAAGATLFIERATLPQDIVNGLRDAGTTVLAAVPPLWAQLLRVPDFRDGATPTLRVLTCAGGRLPPEHVKAVRTGQPQASLFLMYGLTEVFRSTYLPAQEVDAYPESMGRAVPGSAVLVLREDGSPCDNGEIGELVHRGPTVALGYWRDQEATDRVFRPHPLRLNGTPTGERVVFSGDLVKRDDGGRLFYVGRRDRMIKTLGYRVSPDEICDVLMASGQLVEASVVSAPDAQRGEKIIAHIVFKESGKLDQLRLFAANELPRYMQPVKYQAHDALPRNATGKIDLVGLSALSAGG